MQQTPDHIHFSYDPQTGGITMSLYFSSCADHHVLRMDRQATIMFLEHIAQAINDGRTFQPNYEASTWEWRN